MKRLASSICTLMVIAVVSWGIAGCVAPTSQVVAPTQVVEKAAEKVVTAEPAAAAGTSDLCSGLTGKKIAYSPLTMETDFFQLFAQGMKEAAAKCGVELAVDDPKNDAAKQVAGVENLVTTKPAAIAITSVDPKAIVTAVETANKAGVPVFSLFGGFEGTKSDLGPSNLEIGLLTGRPAGEWAKERLPTDRKLQVAFLNNDSLGEGLLERKKGVIQGWEESIKNYEIVMDVEALTEDEGFNAMETILQKYPNIDAVLGTNGDSAVGAITVLENKGRKVGKDVIAAISGNSKREIELVRDGKAPGGPYADATVWGNAAAETIFKYLKGEKVAQAVPLPLSVLTPENAAEALQKYYP